MADFPGAPRRDSTAAPVVRVAGLSFAYGEQPVLEEVDLAVLPGEILCVMGPSGCGKTTLLRLLIGLERPARGSLNVLGEDLARLDEDGLDRFRRRIGMCFQFGALFNSLTVGDNLALPLREDRRLPESLISAIVRSRLAQVGLSGADSKMPAELSGGMKKRAGLARALVLDPEILFFDEPSSGLDPVTAAGLDRTILDVRRRTGTAMVIVTHDLAAAFAVADRILVLIGGRVHAVGTPEEIRRAADPAVNEFVERRAAESSGQGGAEVIARAFV